MEGVACPECGAEISLPEGARANDRISCPSCAGVVIRLASTSSGALEGRRVPTASCPHCERLIELAEDARAGDVVLCDVRPFRLTVEHDAFALEALEAQA